MTSLSEHAQKLQAEADMKTGERIRGDVADVEGRWAKLRQSVEEKEQLMQVQILLNYIRVSSGVIIRLDIINS